MLYKVLVQRGSQDDFEIVEAPDIGTAERATGGIVVALAERPPERPVQAEGPGDG